MDPVDVNYDLYQRGRTFLFFKDLRDRSNPLEVFNEIEFIRRFRITKHMFMDLLDNLQLDRATNRSNAVPSAIQLGVTLQFYATGTYQYALGDLRGISQPTVSRIVRDTTKSIASLSSTYILFPQSQAGKMDVYRGFREKMRIPSIIGAIDCTHIRIKNPSGHGTTFFNRKGYPSFNVQVIVTNDYIIQDIVARHPGSAHDSRIYNTSAVKQRLESGDLQGSMIIGDQGYACSQVLLTPVRFPRTQAEKDYNFHFIRARGCVERTFGVLKARFSVLGPDSRIRLKYETANVVVVACAVLHNLCVLKGVTFEDDIPCNLQNFNQNVIESENSARGSVYRATLISRFFFR